MRLELTLLAALATMGCAAQADNSPPTAQVEQTRPSPITALETLRVTKGVETTRQPRHEAATIGIITPVPTVFGKDSCPACGRG